MPEYGLGRLAFPDARDRQFLLAPPVVITHTRRAWYDNGWWGNQGALPQCVGYAWSHFLEDAPKTHMAPGPIVSPRTIYVNAQTMDEWPGEGYEGTSVRAGAKYLQSIGAIGEYRWAFDADTIARQVLEIGPVVMGTNWHQAMFTPDAKGIIHVEGDLAGGHAWIINGYNGSTRMFRMKNSWGREWGRNGRASISYKDVGDLLAADGEAAMAVEV